jgi:type IV pilus assembly protein PilB
MATAGGDPITGLVKSLVQHRWISDQSARSVLARCQSQSLDQLDALILENIPNIDGLALARFCSSSFSHPFLDLSSVTIGSVAIEAMPIDLIKQLRVVPLKKRGAQLFVAIANPTNFDCINRLQSETQCTIEIVVAEQSKIDFLIAQISAPQTNVSHHIQSAQAYKAEEVSLKAEGAEVDDTTVVKFLEKILLDAIEQGASDIHFEPFEHVFRIRYRVDGLLMEVAQPPVILKDRISSRLKIISKIDISEKRVPQDGRVKISVGGTKVIDFRVSTLPTLFGEKIVMRILDSSQAKLGIDALGYDPAQKEKLMFAVGRPYGMILVTGPTGSGKTVSLYSCLNILNKPGVNISTAEDPAEINLPGINQVNINDKAGLTFPVALKAFLRQDPDVIMVGEIRDLETADIAIKAAQTGHLVLSTLHTNDAPATLTRLMNMGVPAFNIASSIILITGQRLARRLCVCKQVGTFSPSMLTAAGFNEADSRGQWRTYVPIGCDKCKGSGYKGRVGIYQVMPITEAMQSIILANGSALDIERQARAEGVLSLRESGLEKVKQGVTSIEEVLAVTNV